MQTTARSHDSAATRTMPPIAPAGSTAPTASTPMASHGDQCSNCGSLMAADQRYCVDCGERRGEPRLPFMDGRTAISDAPTAAAPPPPLPGYGSAAPLATDRRSAGMALAGTIALLLLAMGVGVMIGNEGDGAANTTAQQPVIVGGAMAGATAATAATGVESADAETSEAATAAPVNKAGVNADDVAKKNGVKLAPKDVGVGDKCEPGSVGCEDGEFTGDYFGE